jgi:hypothetical protein
MFRFYLRYSLILLILLMIILPIICLQPFDDGGLHATLFSDTCSTACLVGIQAGVTTATQARDLLEKQGLVYEWIETQADNPALGQLRWRWNMNRPALFTGTDASLTYDRKTGVVITFGEMGTRLSLGQMLILLGQPSVGFMSGGYNDRDGSTFIHSVGYPQWQLNLTSAIHCPMTLRQLWDAPVTLQLAPTTDQNERFTTYPAHVQAILGYAANFFC